MNYDHVMGPQIVEEERFRQPAKWFDSFGEHYKMVYNQIQTEVGFLERAMPMFRADHILADLDMTILHVSNIPDAESTLLGLKLLARNDENKFLEDICNAALHLLRNLIRRMKATWLSPCAAMRFETYETKYGVPIPDN